MHSLVYDIWSKGIHVLRPPDQWNPWSGTSRSRKSMVWGLQIIGIHDLQPPDQGNPWSGTPRTTGTSRSMESMIWDPRIEGIHDLRPPEQVIHDLGSPDQGNPWSGTPRLTGARRSRETIIWHPDQGNPWSGVSRSGTSSGIPRPRKPQRGDARSARNPSSGKGYPGTAPPSENVWFSNVFGRDSRLRNPADSLFVLPSPPPPGCEEPGTRVGAAPQCALT